MPIQAPLLKEMVARNQQYSKSFLNHKYEN